MSTALAMEDVGKFGLGLTSLLVDYTKRLHPERAW
jgi:hypothetical protein